jgi:hypothetical protein
MEQHTCVLHGQYIGKSGINVNVKSSLAKNSTTVLRLPTGRFTKIARSNGITLFTKFFHEALDSVKFGLGLREFLSVLARVDGYQGPTFAGELVMILYPSNTFLRFPAAVFTFKLDLGIINNIDHTHLQRR